MVKSVVSTLTNFIRMLNTGDILYAYVLNRQMVIFNTFADARDIMGRSIKHSDRPRLVAQEL